MCSRMAFHADEKRRITRYCVSRRYVCFLFTFFAVGAFAQPEIPDWRPPVSTFRIPKNLTLCGEAIPLVREDVRERLEREFYYTRDMDGQIGLYLKRAARAYPIVEEILKEEGLPDDLKFVPVAESGLVFRARSPAAAAGYWQFIKGTAKRYGLRVDRYVDERRDLRKSTKAAAAYLRELREEFGSWAVALAAYNWGENSVRKAIKEQGVSDYYDLYLPDETDRFVFRIALIKLLLENPQGYAIYVPEDGLYEAPKLEEVVVTSNTWLSVDVLSAAAGIAPRTLRFLNKWMNTNTLPSGRYVFALPKEKAEGYVEKVTMLLEGKKRVVHVVKRGEYLSIIAGRYGVAVGEIERWNNISRGRPIHPGQKLIIIGKG